jgi:predicted nucleic acid-binding protein
MTTFIGDLRAVFVDTSAWLALANRRDRRHAEAAATSRALGHTLRVTTWGVVCETYTWLLYHLGHAPANRWLHEQAGIEEVGLIETVFPTPTLDAGTRRVLARFSDQQLSYVDALTIHVVRLRPDIEAVFAFDHHLMLAGAQLLPGPTS